MDLDIQKARQEIIDYIDKWTANHISKDFSFRPFQKKAIIDIIYNIIFSNKNSTHIIEAPTGSGKSLINIISAGVLSEYYNKTSYILCSDLYLWEQYAQFIRSHRTINFGMLKGQTGNYTCEVNGEDMRNSDCRMCGLSWSTMFNDTSARKYGYTCARRCEYVRERKRAVKAPVVLMTYQLYMYQVNVVSASSDGLSSFTNRDVLFCDECHNVVDIIQQQHSATIKESDFEKMYSIYNWALNRNQDLFAETQYEICNKFTLEGLKTYFNKFFYEMLDENMEPQTLEVLMNEYQDVLSDLLTVVNDLQADIAERKQAGEHVDSNDKDLFKLTSFLKNYLCFWGDFNDIINETGPEFIIKQVSKVENAYIITLSCIKEDYMTYKYLLNTTQNVVMTSATVGGKAAFEENNGAKFTPAKEFMRDTIPSTFDFSKSPVIYLNRHKMSFKEKEKSWEKLKPMVYKILERHKGQKGIIQTGSYANAQQLVFDAPATCSKRLLLYNDSKEKNIVISRHKVSEDSVLVGPSLCEGIDLPDDDCRFIIILKVPYPSLADKLVKEKMKVFPLWYQAKTSNIIIQGIGRGVRNSEDWCTTYILDACFFKLYTDTKEQYSTELQQRIKLVN